MAAITNRELARSFLEYSREDSKTYKLSFVLMFVTLAFELARPYILKVGLDYIEAGDVAGLMRTAYLLLGVLFLEYLSRSGFSYLVSIAFLRTINRIREATFRYVLGLKMAFFDRQPVGVLLTRTINDSEALSETLRSGIATILVDVLTVIIVFGVMMHLDLGLTAVMAVTAPVIWVVVRWCGLMIRNKFLAVRKALAESNGKMAEGITGVEIVQLFLKEESMAADYRDINRVYRQACITSNVYDSLLYAIIDGIAGVVTAAILYVGFNMRFGLVEISTLIVYITLIEKIFVPIRDFSSKLATIQQALAAMQRILGLLKSEARIQQGSHQLTGDTLEISFQKVNFRYQKDGPLVLDDINFSVSPGQVVALVGETGSGKSTIAKLLNRAYDGYEGAIRVGGFELAELNYHSLRSKIAVIHQDVELFPGTLRENISMFDESITEEKILWAIHLVKADPFLEQLPGGLDFYIRENGGDLSSGQMQLIVFARALAHDAPIVLMDEATSSVDSVTEAWIQQAIVEIFKHKTVITVAHRLSTIAAADRILVLKQGRIIEEGDHKALLALEGGYYAGLIEAARLQHGRDQSLVF